MVVSLSKPRLAVTLDVLIPSKERFEIRRRATEALKAAGFKTRYEYNLTEKGRKQAERKAQQMRTVLIGIEHAQINVGESMWLSF